MEKVYMKITIERPVHITPTMVKALLDHRKLIVPVFFDANTNIVIIVQQPRSRHLPRALELIEWLGTR
jgi:hypothetical protein